MESFLKHNMPSFEADFIQELQETGIHRILENGKLILKEEGSVAAIPIVLRGRIRVFQTREEKEFLLYYIQPGESCAMSFHACINHSHSTINAITEEETEVLLIPAEKVAVWLKKYPGFNTFMFGIYNKRYMELLQTVNLLIFDNLEGRMMNYLRSKAEITGTSSLSTTHQEIAQDMGTAREVVSRVLKKLENDAKIVLARNTITLL